MRVAEVVDEAVREDAVGEACKATRAAAAAVQRGLHRRRRNSVRVHDPRFDREHDRDRADDRDDPVDDPAPRLRHAEADQRVPAAILLLLRGRHGLRLGTARPGGVVHRRPRRVVRRQRLVLVRRCRLLALSRVVRLVDRAPLSRVVGRGRAGVRRRRGPLVVPRLVVVARDGRLLGPRRIRVVRMRQSVVRSRLCVRRHSSIRPWCPESSTSGTFQPRNSGGRV